MRGAKTHSSADVQTSSLHVHNQQFLQNVCAQIKMDARDVLRPELESSHQIHPVFISLSLADVHTLLVNHQQERPEQECAG